MSKATTFVERLLQRHGSIRFIYDKFKMTDINFDFIMEHLRICKECTTQKFETHKTVVSDINKCCYCNKKTDIMYKESDLVCPCTLDALGLTKKRQSGNVCGNCRDALLKRTFGTYHTHWACDSKFFCNKCIDFRPRTSCHVCSNMMPLDGCDCFQCLVNDRANFVCASCIGTEMLVL